MAQEAAGASQGGFPGLPASTVAQGVSASRCPSPRPDVHPLGGLGGLEEAAPS